MEVPLSFNMMYHMTQTYEHIPKAMVPASIEISADIMLCSQHPRYKAASVFVSGWMAG